MGRVVLTRSARSLEWSMRLFSRKISCGSTVTYCNSAPEADVRPSGGMGRTFRRSQDKQNRPRRLFATDYCMIKERILILLTTKRNGCSCRDHAGPVRRGVLVPVQPTSGKT